MKYVKDGALSWSKGIVTDCRFESKGSSIVGPSLGFLGDKSANALFEQEGCATFIVLFYRPLPDSWRNFKTTTCSPFHTTSLATRPALCPLTRSKAGQGFNCKFKPVLLLLHGKTDTVSAAGDSHPHLTSH